MNVVLPRSHRRTPRAEPLTPALSRRERGKNVSTSALRWPIPDSDTFLMFLPIAARCRTERGSASAGISLFVPGGLHTCAGRML